MTYLEKLSPWCIIRPLPNLRRRIIARFRRRNDAEAHLQVIRRLIPNVAYEIIFDPTPEQKDSPEVTTDVNVSQALPLAKRDEVRNERQH